MEDLNDLFSILFKKISEVQEEQKEIADRIRKIETIKSNNE